MLSHRTLKRTLFTKSFYKANPLVRPKLKRWGERGNAGAYSLVGLWPSRAGRRPSAVSRSATISLHRFDNFENFSRLTSKIVVKLAFPRLQVDTSAIAGLIEWYCDRLGTSVIKEIKSEKELIPQAGQAHYVWVRFSEVIWSEY